MSFSIGILDAKSQNVLFFKDFDYFSFEGLDTLRNTQNLPKNYVECAYNSNNEIVKICFKRYNGPTMSFSYHCGSVFLKNGIRTIFLGAGKTRTGYTRSIFQKKIFETDTAFVVKDTLYFKKASKKYYKIQRFIKLDKGLVDFKQVSFDINSTTKSSILALNNISRHREWNSLDEWSNTIIGGLINIDADPILKFKMIKKTYYLNRIDITKASLDDGRDLPLAFFWLKNAGLLN